MYKLAFHASMALAPHDTPTSPLERQAHAETRGSKGGGAGEQMAKQINFKQSRQQQQ